MQKVLPKAYAVQLPWSGRVGRAQALASLVLQLAACAYAYNRSGWDGVALVGTVVGAALSVVNWMFRPRADVVCGMDGVFVERWSAGEFISHGDIVRVRALKGKQRGVCELERRDGTTLLLMFAREQEANDFARECVSLRAAYVDQARETGSTPLLEKGKGPDTFRAPAIPLEDMLQGINLPNTSATARVALARGLEEAGLDGMRKLGRVRRQLVDPAAQSLLDEALEAYVEAPRALVAPEERGGASPTKP